MVMKKDRINFNYQNLLLEKDVDNEQIKERYPIIKKCTNVLINKGYSSFNTKSDLVNLAKRNLNQTIFMTKNFKFTAKNKTEKLLLVTNTLFNNDDNFIRILKEYNVDINRCHELKDLLNSLDRNDKDYLNGTIAAWIELYIPTFGLIADYYGLKNNNTDFILVKLLELMYLHPEKLIHEQSKTKCYR